MLNFDCWSGCIRLWRMLPSITVSEEEIDFLSELVDFEASLCPKFRLLKLLLVLSWKVTIVNILIVVVVAAVVFVAANLKSTALSKDKFDFSQNLIPPTYALSCSWFSALCITDI